MIIVIARYFREAFRDCYSHEKLSGSANRAIPERKRVAKDGGRKTFVLSRSERSCGSRLSKRQTTFRRISLCSGDAHAFYAYFPHYRFSSTARLLGVLGRSSPGDRSWHCKFNSKSVTPLVARDSEACLPAALHRKDGISRYLSVSARQTFRLPPRRFHVRNDDVANAISHGTREQEDLALFCNMFLRRLTAKTNAEEEPSLFAVRL